MTTPRSWRRWSTVAITAAAGFGLVGWLAVERPGVPAEPAVAAPAHGTPVQIPRVAAPAKVIDAHPDRPPGVSAQQWAALTAELLSRPDGPAELRRLAGYLEWSDALRRFRTARTAGASATELVPLARTLDDGLAERLRLAEVSAAEARQIKSTIFELTVADESLRAQQLQAWAAATFAPTAADPRQAAFERRQSELVAAWSAQPKAARDTAALERQLDSLRQESFSSGLFHAWRHK